MVWQNGLQFDANGNLLTSAINNLSNNTVAIFGDSITQDNWDQSATVTNGRPAWFGIANALLGQRMNIVNSAGYAGDTTAGMVSRLTSLAAGIGFGQVGSAGVPPSIPPGPLVGNPKIIFVMGGFNDIFGSSLSAGIVTSNLQKIYSALLATGALVVAMTVTCPNSSASGYTTANVATLLAVNDFIRATVRSTPGMVLVDAFSAMSNPGSANVEGPAGNYRDGTVHPNNVGGWAIAQKILTALSGILSPTDTLPSSNAATYALSPLINQLVTNPLLTGTAAATGTGISGNGPSPALTYILTGASPSAVISVANRADGYGQNVSCAITATNAGDSLEIRWPSFQANAVIGGQYVATCEVNVTGPGAGALVASNQLAGVQLGFQYNNGTTNYFCYDWSYRGSVSPAADAPFSGGSFTAVLRTRPLIIPAGTPTVFRPFVDAFFQGAGGCVLSVGRMAVYRIA